MPYPPQVNKERIVQQAHAIVEKEGSDALSLGKVATQLGIKAPSLYRHVGNKASLIQAVNLYTIEQLFAAIEQAVAQASDDPYEQLLATAHAFRGYAHKNPQTYILAFTTPEREDENLLVKMVQPIQKIMTKWVGEDTSLTALRGATALIHGFIMLELHQQLRRGGDLNEAFEQTFSAYLKGYGQQRTSVESHNSDLTMRKNDATLWDL